MPMKKLTLTLVSSLALMFTAGTASASGLINAKPLMKELMNGSPGLEMVVPLIEEVDSNQDNYPDKIKVRFRVYAGGTTNNLLSTVQRNFTPPAAPCQNWQWLDWDWDVDFIGEEGKWTGMVLYYYVECQEIEGGIEEAEAAFVYMAKTSDTGTSWAKSWNRWMISAHIDDWDNDAQEEVSVILGVESNNTEKFRVIHMKKTSGNVESDKSYTGVKAFPEILF